MSPLLYQLSYTATGVAGDYQPSKLLVAAAYPVSSPSISGFRDGMGDFARTKADIPSHIFRQNIPGTSTLTRFYPCHRFLRGKNELQGMKSE